MPPNTETITIRQEYQRLKLSKEEFLTKYGKTIGNSPEISDQELTEAKRSLAFLKHKRDLLDQRLWPFEELPQQKLKEQYQSQKEAFQSIGLLTQLSSPKASENIIGLSSNETIDGQSYPFPSFEEIRKSMKKNKEMLTIKISQGFNKLLIIPIALKLPVFQDKAGSLIKTKHGQGRLLGTKEPRGSQFQPLEIDDEPLYIWRDILEGEQTGKLIYYPQVSKDKKNLDESLGLTKPQLIKQLAQTPFPGYEVLLIEDNLYLPKKGEGKTRGKDKDCQRKQLENNDKAINYLNTITDPSPVSPYRHEIPFTIETFFIDFLLHLEATDHVKYDYDDNSIPFLIGNSVSGGVLGGYWYRNFRRLGVGSTYPNYRYEDWGCPPAVRVLGDIVIDND